MIGVLHRLFPLLATLRGYGAPGLRADLVAGLTTAVMLVPQGMAYATLAGLPPVYGLYASTVPLVIYAFIGTSRQLAIGPVAMDSLLVASGVSALAAAGTDAYIGYAIVLSLLVGGIQFATGALRLGFLVNLLSRPVIIGFMTAAALIISASQLGTLLGTDVPRSERFHELVLGAGRSLAGAHLPTIAVGAVSLLLLAFFKRRHPTFPRALLVVAAGTLTAWGLGLEEQGVAIVGEIPSGLPTPRLPVIDADAVRSLLPTALTIALVGFLEAVSVAKTFARKHGEDVNANRELLGLGAANIAGGLFRGFPIAGGLSRTAVNHQAGATTQVASLVTAATVAATLLFLTPLFHYLPRAVLAAIIVAAVGSLIDIAEIRHVWKVKREDLTPLAATFATTLALGIHVGIGVGVAASLLLFVLRSTRPHVAVLGRLPSGIYRNVDRHPEARTHPGILLLRLDAQFYFGNVAFLRDALHELERDRPELRAVVLDASGINQLDYSGASALREIHDEHESRGIHVFYVAVKGPVMDVLKPSGFVAHVGEERFFDALEDAERHILTELRDAKSWAGAFI